MTRKPRTKSARARELLDQGKTKAEVARKTKLSRQAVDAAAAARGPRGRPKRHAEGGERVSLYVSPETAAWLRAEAERDGCTLGDVVEGARLAIQAADAGLDHELRLARRGLRMALLDEHRRDRDLDDELAGAKMARDTFRRAFGGDDLPE